MWTNAADYLMRELIADDVYGFTLGAVAAPNVESLRDYQLGSPSPYFSKELTAADIVIDHVTDVVTVTCVVEEGEANGTTWTEIGLFSKRNGGVFMLMREVLTISENKNGTKRFVYIFKLKVHV